MNPAALSGLADLVRPHALSVAVLAARLAKATFLVPLLGGHLAPAPVRLALCLALTLHAHFAGGVACGLAPDAAAFDVATSFAREVAIGIAIGLVAALPFDAARMGGRFLDTFRGANAEATLPATGSSESATGDRLHQLLCALVCAGPVYGLLASALLRSFGAVPPCGTGLLGTAGLAELVLRHATTALAAGLSIGAPVAAVALLVALAVGIAGRVAPTLSARELAAPARLLLGGAAIFLLLGAASERLLDEVAGAAASVSSLGPLLAGPR